MLNTLLVTQVSYYIKLIVEKFYSMVQKSRDYAMALKSTPEKVPAKVLHLNSEAQGVNNYYKLSYLGNI